MSAAGLAVAFAFLLAIVVLSDLYHRNVCVGCGGRNAHRKDCPFDKDEP